MAEWSNAPGSGPGGLVPSWVRIPAPALRKRRKKQEWVKKWAPMILLLVMIFPSFMSFTYRQRIAEVTLRFRYYGQVGEERVQTQENATLVEILSRYPLSFENDTIYCIGALCGEWKFYANDREVNPFTYRVKNKDVILLDFIG